MPGLLYNRLFEVAASQYGYVTAADARALGAPVERLSTMAARGTLVRVSSGVYRFDGIEQHLGDELIEQAIDAARARGAIRTRDLAEIETVRRAAAEA